MVIKNSQFLSWLLPFSMLKHERHSQPARYEMLLSSRVKPEKYWYFWLQFYNVCTNNAMKADHTSWYFAYHWQKAPKDETQDSLAKTSTVYIIRALHAVLGPRRLHCLATSSAYRFALLELSTKGIQYPFSCSPACQTTKGCSIYNPHQNVTCKPSKGLVKSNSQTSQRYPGPRARFVGVLLNAISN